MKRAGVSAMRALRSSPNFARHAHVSGPLPVASSGLKFLGSVVTCCCCGPRDRELTRDYFSGFFFGWYSGSAASVFDGSRVLRMLVRLIGVLWVGARDLD